MSIPSGNKTCVLSIVLRVMINDFSLPINDTCVFVSTIKVFIYLNGIYSCVRSFAYSLFVSRFLYDILLSSLLYSCVSVCMRLIMYA